MHVEPSVLVVPAELETVGEQLITEIKPVEVGEVNPFSKLVKMVVEPRLPALRLVLGCAAVRCDGLEYAYLARSPGPQLRVAARLRGRRLAGSRAPRLRRRLRRLARLVLQRRALIDGRHALQPARRA